MSLTKKYAVRVKFYSGFKPSEDRVEKFDNILDAWKFYKDSKSKDFDYGDAFQDTQEIYAYWLNITEKTHFIGHDLVKRKPRTFKLSPEERAHLLDFSTWNPDDEEIII